MGDLDGCSSATPQLWYPRRRSGSLRFNPSRRNGRGGLLKAIEGGRLETLHSLALAIGLREEEAFGLHWPDLDFNVGTLGCLRLQSRRSVTIRPARTESA